MYKLVSLDLDGTLLNDSKELTPQVRDTLVRVKKKGVTVVISTGRSYLGVQRYLEFLGRNLVDYVIGFNGALIHDVQKERVVTRRCLTIDQLNQIAELASHVSLPVHFVTDNEILTPVNPIGKYTVQEAFLTEARLSYREMEDFPLEVNFYKALFSEEAKVLEESTNKIPSDFHEKFTLVKSDDTYLEIIKDGTSKGNSLKELIGNLEIDSEQVISIGDQENDIEMLEFSGLGISMGNAVEKVKKVADVITKTNNDNGVVYALEKFIL